MLSRLRLWVTPEEAIPTPTIPTPVPPVPTVDVPIEQSDSELVMSFGNRRYRIRVGKPLNPEALKVNLLVSQRRAFPCR